MSSSEFVMPDARPDEHTDYAQRVQHRKELEQKIFTVAFIDAASIRCVPNKPCLLYEGRMFHTLPELKEAVNELRRKAKGEIQIELNPSDNEGRGARLYYLYKPHVPTADKLKPDENDPLEPPSYLDILTDADCARLFVTARSIAERHPEWVPPVDRKVLARQLAKEKAAKQKEADLRRLVKIIEKEKKEEEAKQKEEEERLRLAMKKLGAKASSATTSGTAFLPNSEQKSPDASKPSASLSNPASEDEEKLSKLVQEMELVQKDSTNVRRAPLRANLPRKTPAFTIADQISVLPEHHQRAIEDPTPYPTDRS
jgi:hypothetical protein